MRLSVRTGPAVLEDSVVVNRRASSVDVFSISSFASGLVVPIPTLPPPVTLNVLPEPHNPNWIVLLELASPA